MCLHGASWEWSQRSSRLAAGCQWTSVWQEGGEGGGGRREEGKGERVGREKMGEGKSQQGSHGGTG